MAGATNCLEWFFDQKTTSLAAATRHDFAAQTIQIPETSSRTFRSVTIQIDVIDNSATAVSLTSWLIGIKLGAVAFDDVTVTETIANTGEHQSFRFRRDVTSYFASNFGAGATQTCQVGVQFGALAVINVCAKLIITYEFDDAATSRAKTVRLPMQSPLATLTATLAELGTNQVPQLTGAGSPMLPEASITVDQITFECEANEVPGATTDYSLCLALDSEGEAQDGLHEQALNTARRVYRSWIRNDMDTTAAHAFKARVTVSGKMQWLNVILYVTYRYDEASTSVVLNSRILCGEFRASVQDAFDGSKSRQTLKWWIEEPTTITLKQSAIRAAITETASADVTAAAGSQTPLVYTDKINIVGETCDRPFLHRVDLDSGLSIARGENTLTLDLFTDVATGSMGFQLFLNYHSGKAAKTAIHAHSTYWQMEVDGAVGPVSVITAMAPVIPETNYYAEVGFVAAHLGIMSTDGFYADAECSSGEWAGDGWALIQQGNWKSSAETGWVEQFAGASGLYKQYPSSPHARMALETTRRYRRGSSGADIRGAMGMWLDYHGISYSTTRELTGYTGDGSGIAVDIFRADTDEKVAEATSVTGGDYTFVWYDNVIELYAVARQDGTHVGRSDNFIAGS